MNRPINVRLYPDRLPEPDDWGSYYMSEGSFRSSGAAIFPCRNRDRKGKFHASDHSGEPLVEGDHLRLFDSADEALRYMRAQVGEV